MTKNEKSQRTHLKIPRTPKYVGLILLTLFHIFCPILACSLFNDADCNSDYSVDRMNSMWKVVTVA
jgi:hypothetical protein